MLNITLLNPPGFSSVPCLPYELAQVGSVLERDRHRVVLLDAQLLNIQPDEIPSILTNPDVVIIHSVPATAGLSVRCADRIRSKFPETVIIVFGEHPTVRPSEFMEAADAVNIIVRGEPEETLFETCRALSEKNQLKEIHGISYRENGCIIHNLDRPKYIIMDAFPYPAWHLCDLKKYRYESPHGKASPVIEVRTSRGTVSPSAWQSSAPYGTTFREKSEDRVIDELAYVKERFNAKEILFSDEWFLHDKERIRRLCERMIKVGLKLSWTCIALPDMIDRMVTLNMKRAGCFAVEIPLFSASRQILDTLGVNPAIEKAETAVKTCRDNGLQTLGRFVLGAPGETALTIQQTVEFARSLNLDYAAFSILQPSPGTSLYNAYLASGNPLIEWETLIYSDIENKNAPVFESEQLDRVALIEYQQRAVKFVSSSNRRQESFENFEPGNRSLLGRFRKSADA